VSLFCYGNITVCHGTLKCVCSRVEILPQGQSLGGLHDIFVLFCYKLIVRVGCIAKITSTLYVIGICNSVCQLQLLSEFANFVNTRIFIQKFN